MLYENGLERGVELKSYTDEQLNESWKSDMTDGKMAAVMEGVGVGLVGVGKYSWDRAQNVAEKLLSGGVIAGGVVLGGLGLAMDYCIGRDLKAIESEGGRRRMEELRRLGEVYYLHGDLLDLADRDGRLILLRGKPVNGAEVEEGRLGGHYLRVTEKSMYVVTEVVGRDNIEKAQRYFRKKRQDCESLLHLYGSWS